MATSQIYDAFLDTSLDKALMHGPTFMANPLACAAGLASLSLFKSTDYAEKVEAIELQLQRELAPLSELKGVKNVRIKGAIGVMQIDANQEDMFAMRPKFIEQGVWLCPFHDCVYILPPLVIHPSELARLSDAVKNCLSEWSKTKE